MAVFSFWPFLNIFKGLPMRPSNNLENKTPSDTYRKIELVCMKVQSHSSLEPPLEYNQDQMPLLNEGLLWRFEPYWKLQIYAISD